MRVKYAAKLTKHSPDGDRDNIILRLSAKGTNPDNCDEQIRQLIKLRYPDYRPLIIKRLKIDEQSDT